MFRKKFGNKYPVIDSHLHLGVQPNSVYLEDDLTRDMDASGIDVQVIFQNVEGYQHKTPVWNPYIGNDYIASVQEKYPDKVIGLGSVNPWMQSPKASDFPLSARGKNLGVVTEDPALDEVRRCMLDLGLWGLKMHPLFHGYHINSSVVQRVLDTMVECQKKVSRQLFIVCHMAGDSIFNSPEALGDLAEAYPEILFLAAHAGYPWGTYTLSTALGKLDNVKIDLSNCPNKSTASVVYDKYGVEKFTQGSDMPYATYGMAKAIVEDIFESPEDREMVRGGNLANALRISFS